MISYNPAENGDNEWVSFFDQHQRHCVIWHSSAIEDECIWLGLAALNADRMHLSRENVRELLPFLIAFAETGELKPKLEAVPLAVRAPDILADEIASAISKYVLASLMHHCNASHLTRESQIASYEMGHAIMVLRDKLREFATCR